MIKYDPLWVTMKSKNITKYYLKTYCEINNNTLHKLKYNQPLNTTTIERLCEILDCNVQDIMTYEKKPNNIK